MNNPNLVAYSMAEAASALTALERMCDEGIVDPADPQIAERLEAALGNLRENADPTIKMKLIADMAQSHYRDIKQKAEIRRKFWVGVEKKLRESCDCLDHGVNGELGSITLSDTGLELLCPNKDGAVTKETIAEYKIPEEFVKQTVTHKIDKIKVKAALKDGIKLSFARKCRSVRFNPIKGLKLEVKR